MLLALAVCAPPAAPAPLFEPSRWNEQQNASASGISFKLLFPAPPGPDDEPVPESGPLFPVKPRAGPSELEVSGCLLWQAYRSAVRYRSRKNAPTSTPPPTYIHTRAHAPTAAGGPCSAHARQGNCVAAASVTRGPRP